MGHRRCQGLGFRECGRQICISGAPSPASGFAVVVHTGRHRLRRAIDDPGHRVVVQIRADAGQVDDDINADLVQMGLRANARQHQQLR